MEIWRWIRVQWDRSAAVVAFVAGLVELLRSWIGVSGASLPSEQIPYLASDTVLGVFGLGVAATLWLSADLRDEWRSLDEISQRLEDLQERSEAERLSATTILAAVRGESNGTRAIQSSTRASGQMQNAHSSARGRRAAP
jgi:hypothetical protein